MGRFITSRLNSAIPRSPSAMIIPSPSIKPEPEIQAGCWSGFKRSIRKKNPTPRSNLPPGGLTADRSGTQPQLPEYTFATSCDFCGHGDQNRSANWWPADKPPSYTPMGANDIFRPEVMKTIEETLTALSSELRELSLKIHDHPELGFQEKYTHDTMTQFMSSKGWEVTKHYLGLDTAWRAEFTVGTGGRTLGVNSEMDALPGIGHACGHNLIAIAGVGVALAVKTALEKHGVPGKVVLLGTPAEEGGGGKIILIERGGYKDMDACVMCHPGPGPSGSIGTGPSLAFQSINVEYFGHTAHASAAPWEAVNALDAAFLAYSNVSVLRQQMKPDHRVHGIVEGKNWAPNIIPDYAGMRWFVRAPTGAQLKVWRDRVVKCFEAAAHATGCKYTITYGQLTYDLLQNPVLTEELVSTLHDRYGMTGTPAEGAIGGSTDFGNVTYELPSIHPSFAIPTKPGGGNHTIGFTEAARTEEAHEATLQVAKGLALVGFRVINDEKFFYKVKDSFHPNK